MIPEAGVPPPFRQRPRPQDLLPDCSTQDPTALLAFLEGLGLVRCDADACGHRAETLEAYDVKNGVPVYLFRCHRCFDGHLDGDGVPRRLYHEGTHARFDEDAYMWRYDQVDRRYGMDGWVWRYERGWHRDHEWTAPPVDDTDDAVVTLSLDAAVGRLERCAARVRGWASAYDLVQEVVEVAGRIDFEEAGVGAVEVLAGFFERAQEAVDAEGLFDDRARMLGVWQRERPAQVPDEVEAAWMRYRARRWDELVGATDDLGAWLFNYLSANSGWRPPRTVDPVGLLNQLRGADDVLVEKGWGVIDEDSGMGPSLTSFVRRLRGVSTRPGTEPAFANLQVCVASALRHVGDVSDVDVLGIVEAWGDDRVAADRLAVEHPNPAIVAALVCQRQGDVCGPIHLGEVAARAAREPLPEVLFVELVDAWAEARNPAIATALGSNPVCPPAAQRRLAVHDRVEVAIGVASNPNLDAVAARIVADRPVGSDFRETQAKLVVAANPVCPPDVAERARANARAALDADADLGKEHAPRCREPAPGWFDPRVQRCGPNFLLDWAWGYAAYGVDDPEVVVALHSANCHATRVALPLYANGACTLDEAVALARLDPSGDSLRSWMLAGADTVHDVLRLVEARVSVTQAERVATTAGPVDVDELIAHREDLDSWLAGLPPRDTDAVIAQIISPCWWSLVGVPDGRGPDVSRSSPPPLRR